MSEDDVSDADDDEDEDVTTNKQQDLHFILRHILNPYRKLERNGGFIWDLPYRGKIHHDVQIIPFVMFIKGDTQEHDKHCGSFTSRTQKVRQLCRYCCCPNEETENPYPKKDWKLKNPQMIKKLVERGDVEGLREMSQQHIYNTWHLFDFGAHNKLGVHSACPLEILHWLLLGKYKTGRDMFFTQLGEESMLSNEINDMACVVGILYGRQSDRDLPRTNFSKGIKKGKLMGHEMSGLILVLVTVMTTARGRDLLINDSRGKNAKFFGSPELVRDWILLLETWLQMEQWLRKSELRVSDVRRFKTKIREIMMLEKTVGQRTKGMGFNTFKFHAAMHLFMDMLNYGVPANVDTMADEMHHKGSKTAAKRTQRRPEEFDFQVAKQLHNMYLVSMGMEEIKGKAVFNYYDKIEEIPQNDKENFQAHGYCKVARAKPEICFANSPEDLWNQRLLEKDLGGTHFVFHGTTYSIENIRSKREKQLTNLPYKLLCYLLELQEDLPHWTGSTGEVEQLHLFTTHKREGTIFRASPRYRKKPWMDWVNINWGPDGISPAHIWCFVDLTEDENIAMDRRQIYAVVEGVVANDDHPQESSELFDFYVKESTEDNAVFRLVEVGTFHSPACVIPDIGNKQSGAYLSLKPRSEWASMFEKYLRGQHQEDFDMNS